MVETNSLQFESDKQNEVRSSENNKRPTQLPSQFPAFSGRPPIPTLGHSELVDRMCSSVDQDLLISKTFYFFFFSAFGSLFPLMGIFFKQLGMNPVQCGVLVGFRPLVEFISAPFWGSMADQYRKGKQILLSSLFCWILFTLSLSFVQTPVAVCVIYNRTHHLLVKPKEVHDLMRPKRSISNDTLSTLNVFESEEFLEYPYQEELVRVRRHWDDNNLPPGHITGQSPIALDFADNYDNDLHSSFVKPVFSTVVYKKDDVRKTFLLILLIVTVGEFFSAPAITLADSVTLTYLGENANNYGKQRMFGSLGWGLAMFFVGIALDHSTVFPYHPCGSPHEHERNYTICFAVFCVLMGCALITATQFRFDYELFDEDIALKQLPKLDHVQQQQQYQQQNHYDQPQQYQQQDEPPEFQVQPTNPFKTELEENNQTSFPVPNGEYSAPENTGEAVPEKPEKSKVFASTTKRIPEWLQVLKTIANLRYGSFLFVAWWMGFGIGLVFTFLFWHLQDLGGTPTLFGVASVINHTSEIAAYFFSFRLIKRLGHVKVLCIGLTGNLARFLYISWVSDPWWVLPFEFLQGITHAAVWAACCSYITQATSMQLRTSAQGVLQGLHHGLGRGCGAVLGGFVATYAGTAIAFRLYGVFCLIFLAAFVFIHFYRVEEGSFVAPQEEEPHEVLEDNIQLAPHGVPSSPMPRVLSSSRLEHLNGNIFEPHTTAGHLDIPKSGGGGGGGSGGPGGNWNPSNFTGNKNSDVQFTRKSLEEAFQLKTKGSFDYDYITNNYKNSNDLFSACNNNNSEVELLKAPMPKMKIASQQPEIKSSEASYA
uniref:Major facilitator superfamily associated domain-containing protein n=1 Tax=Strigamia maritima TaxID=126957 RepID=T1IUP3_STRMM